MKKTVKNNPLVGILVNPYSTKIVHSPPRGGVAG